MSEEYRFTMDWFTRHISVWEPLIDKAKPQKILEIGTFEGRSTVFMIEQASKHHDSLELHCVDTWLGSPEHGDTDFGAVEARFWQNVSLAKTKVPGKNINVIQHKGTSLIELSKLAAEGHLNSFDWVLVDGSHIAVDVLYDAVMAFHMAKPNGVIVFDDYNVAGSTDNLGFPKIAIDSFGYIFREHVRMIPMYMGSNMLSKDDLYQLYLIKSSD